MVRTLRRAQVISYTFPQYLYLSTSYLLPISARANKKLWNNYLKPTSQMYLSLRVFRLIGPYLVVIQTYARHYDEKHQNFWNFGRFKTDYGLGLAILRCSPFYRYDTAYHFYSDDPRTTSTKPQISNQRENASRRPSIYFTQHSLSELDIVRSHLLLVFVTSLQVTYSAKPIRVQFCCLSNIRLSGISIFTHEVN